MNAVVHRDYSIQGSAIRLSLFEDRLEINSPGCLPNNLTIESMVDQQAPETKCSRPCSHACGWAKSRADWQPGARVRYARAHLRLRPEHLDQRRPATTSAFSARRAAAPHRRQRIVSDRAHRRHRGPCGPGRIQHGGVATIHAGDGMMAWHNVCASHDVRSQFDGGKA